MFSHRWMQHEAHDLKITLFILCYAMGFKPWGRHQEKSKSWLPVVPKKDFCPEIFKKNYMYYERISMQ